MPARLTTNIHHSLNQVDKDKYNALAEGQNLFLEFGFLSALEESGCIGEQTSWQPRIIIISNEEGDYLAALTYFNKYDSYGEYIFDWEWAGAYQRSGISYYPKGLVAVPFTPATGSRMLVKTGEDFEMLATCLVDTLVRQAGADNLSSIHFLFITEKEVAILEKKGFFTRLTHQYHWLNEGYNEFDDYLAALKSKRRKQVKKELREIAEQGVEIQLLQQDEIKPEHIDTVFQFYQDTGARKWGRPYLNRQFFDLIYRQFRHRMLLCLGRREDSFPGGTINFFDEKNLFGRYWGQQEYIKHLHFACCFYSLIEYSIKNGIEKFEAGAQGEHKFTRGFLARLIYSSHFFFDAGAGEVLGRHLKLECLHTRRLVEEYNKNSPFGKNDGR